LKSKRLVGGFEDPVLFWKKFCPQNDQLILYFKSISKKSKKIPRHASLFDGFRTVEVSWILDHSAVVYLPEHPAKLAKALMSRILRGLPY
jgi:hypothetical protein